MKLEKAIEILERKVKQNVFQVDPDALEALKLGIEALKMIAERRYKPGGMFFHDLPGETK